MLKATFESPIRIDLQTSFTGCVMGESPVVVKSLFHAVLTDPYGGCRKDCPNG